MNGSRTHLAVTAGCVAMLALYCAVAGDVPAVSQLFADEQWYKQARQQERVFEGVIRKEPSPMATSGRWNPVRLHSNQRQMWEVYLGAKTDILDAYVGRQVRITGKAIDMNVEGQEHREIWPAQIELVVAPAGAKKNDTRQHPAGG